MELWETKRCKSRIAINLLHGIHRSVSAAIRSCNFIRPEFSASLAVTGPVNRYFAQLVYKNQSRHIWSSSRSWALNERSFIKLELFEQAVEESTQTRLSGDKLDEIERLVCLLVLSYFT